MKISDILDLVYPQLKECVNPEKVISESKTGEDILSDVCLRALKKYDGRDITFEEGKEYLMKGIKQELFFGYKKIKNDNLVYVESVWDNETEDPEE